MTDTCPNCVRRGIPPTDSLTGPDHIVHGYRCPGCGHQLIGRHAAAQIRSLQPA